VNRALDDGSHWVCDRDNDLRNWISRDRGQEPRPQIYANPLPDPQRPLPLTRPRTDDLPNSIPGTDTGSFCKIPTNTGNPQRPDLFKPYFDARLKFDPNASEEHTVYKVDNETGLIRSYETFVKNDNPKFPYPFKSLKRVDMLGKPHYNNVTKQYVPTPHVNDPSVPGGVRPANPDEITGR
jgi:hypothetical protein